MSTTILQSLKLKSSYYGETKITNHIMTQVEPNS
jgi:hypothetical protein